MSLCAAPMSNSGSKFPPPEDPNRPDSRLDESLPPGTGSVELTGSPLRVADRSSSPTLAPGDLLANRFRILRFISKGGMGEVYEAEDLELQEHVAIKTILQSIAASPAAIAQFKREIQLARKVTHPNVCRIFDLVLDTHGPQTTAFLSMELLSGITLSEYIERVGTIPTEEALGLARQMADGLHAAHSAGVIHQDFKSGNVIISEPDEHGHRRAVITDFGLAHNLRAAESSASQSVGTPAYMAPEQIEGGPISAATDIYAFGVVLYEMVTGHWPYNARTAEELQSKKLTQAPIPPSKYVPDLPIRAEHAILRCLAKAPQERFGNAIDVVVALEPPRRRWPLIAAAALLLAALGIVGGYQWRKTHATAGEPTVAVVGFRNDSGNSNYDWLATELSESLTTELGGSKGIHAVPTDEVASVKTELSVGQNQSLEREDLSGVREALGANYLLLGRYAVVQQGSELDMNVLLRDSRGNTVTDIHEGGGQGEYRKLVADAGSKIREKLGTQRLSDTQAGELQNLYPADPQASQFYFEGLDKLRSFDPMSALSLLKQASERDPNNVSIHWALSDSWTQLKHDPEAATEAQKAADLAGKGSLPQEYVVLAQGRAAEANKQWDSAIDAYKSLFRLFPEHLSYGLQLASAQIGGSRASDALVTLGALEKLPAPMGNDPRIEMTKAQAYGSMDDFKSQLQAAQLALQEAQKRNARMMQARAQLELCWAHRNLGHVDEAFSACNEAQNLFTVFGDNVSAAVALNDVATWLSDRGQYAQAKQLYDRVIEANQKTGAQKDYAGACINAAAVLIRMGSWQDADDYITRALQAAVPIGDKYDEALAHLNRGEVRSKQGRLSEAQQEAQQAFDLAHALNDRATETRALSNLAEYQSKADPQRAVATYRQAVSLARQTGDKAELSTNLTNMGDLLFRRNQLVEAEKSYEEALQIDTELKDKDAIAHDWAAFAEIDLERGRLTEAEGKLLLAINQLRDLQDADFEAEADSILVSVLVAENKVTDAEPYAKRMQEIGSKDQETAFDTRLSMAEYLNATGKHTEAIQQIASLPEEAKRAGLDFEALEARLELVRLQIGRRPAAELRRELTSIQSDAERAGFKLLVERVKAIKI